MRRILVALFFLSAVVAIAEPLHLSFVVHGRSPLEPQTSEQGTYGLVESVVFAGEPVVVTLTALNPPADVLSWVRTVQWDVVDALGRATTATVTVDGLAPASPRPLPAGASQVNLVLSGLPPGQYTVRASSIDDATSRRVTAEARQLTIYAGDENVTVRRAFLREKARVALSTGTEEGYRAARPLLLEAAEGNTDPSLYETLADASAPWADPEETAAYYDRSAAVARANVERKFGTRSEAWPSKATSLLSARDRKVAAFRALVPYYKTNFSSVRVVVTRQATRDAFVVERRSDGGRLRVIEPQE
jgi:hypothetical protein